MQKIPPEILQRLFLEIDNSISPNLSTVWEIADCLNLSKESVYRRLRGETPFSFNEIYKLVKSYSIAVDNLIDVAQNNRLSATIHTSRPSNFKLYLVDLMRQLSQANERIIWTLPYIANLRLLGYENLFEFAYNILPKYKPFNNVYRLSEGIVFYQEYLELYLTEIWSKSLFSPILSEIEYATACGFIEQNNKVYLLYTELVTLIFDAIVIEKNTNHTIYISETDFSSNNLLLEGSSYTQRIMFVHIHCYLMSNHKTAFELGQQEVDKLFQQAYKVSGQSHRIKKEATQLFLQPILASAKKTLDNQNMNKLEDYITQMSDYLRNKL